ncbi:Uncharacterized protein Rs2_31276 [Raphanus sativus]|nr:Uncharacterized protein Rs2_31276 [Raphanus sativus]
MKKKKPKKSPAKPPAKPPIPPPIPPLILDPSSSPLDSTRSSSPLPMADPISDSLEAFDAQIGPETNVAAQLSPVSPDLVSGFTTPSSPEKVIVGTTTDPSPTVSIPDPSAASISVTEIVAPVTDPSCSVEVQAEPNIELSSVGIPHCSSVIVLEKEVALVETTTKSVVIDAAVIGSVEVAAVDVAAVIDNVEVAGSNLETVNSQETLAAARNSGSYRP